MHLRFAWQAWHLATSTFVLSRTIFVTHNFVTHHLSHTNFVTHHLSHTIFHTPLCLTPSFTTPSFTHHFVTHHLSPPHLSHTSLSHTIFHTPHWHTPSFTHRHRPYFTHRHRPYFTHHIVTNHLSHTIFHTPLCLTPSFTHHIGTHHFSHITLSHALFHTQLSHTPSFTHNFVTHTIFLCHTPSFTYNFVTHNFVLLLDPPPPPLSFLPSPAPLQHYVLIIGRSCLVGLSGPLIRNRRAWMCHLSVPSAPHKWWWKKNWPPKNVSPLAGSYVKQSVLRFCCSFFPGHTTATQLLQPNFHGIGRRGRLLHSHGQSLQQMKQWPQCFHKCHGCATWTKHFACR